MKTTVVLRDDVYQVLISTFGKRNISSAINELLVKYLIKKGKKDMFGVDPWLANVPVSDWRDKHDRDF